MAKEQEVVVQEELIPEKIDKIDKGLVYTKAFYETIADSAKANLDNPGDDKMLNIMEHGVYYNAIAGMLRSGALCSRVTGEDGFPEIRIVAGTKTYQCREDILRTIFGKEADYIIAPYEDRFESYLDQSRILLDKWYKATVPGTVYTDLLDNGLMEDPYYRDNEDKALRLMDYDYEYRMNFALPKGDELMDCDEVLLKFEMLDTVADIYLNGNLVDSVCNMHRTFEYGVKDSLKAQNELRIVFHSPNAFIKKEFENDPVLGSEDCSKGFPKLRKAHYMFGWDWGPRLPDAGIMRPVSLVGVKKARLYDVYVIQDHEDGKVTLTVDHKYRAAHCAFESATDYRNLLNKCITTVTVTDPEGKEIATNVGAPYSIAIENPQLWWPNGYGKQPLYTVRVELKDSEGELLDVWEKRIGLRTMTISCLLYTSPSPRDS